MLGSRNIYSAVALLLGGLLLAACGSATTANLSDSGENTGINTASTGAAGHAALNVVATTSIIADLVENVGGGRVAVKALLPPGADPHTYSPSPADVQAVAESQIVFENGLGLEVWLDELIRNAGGSRPVVVVSDGLTPIKGGGESPDDATTTTTSDADPHMWFDVQNTIQYVANIRDGLKQADPGGASLYEANAAAYIDQLKRLDAEIVQQVASIPADRRKLVTNHDTFAYFARRYGFQVVGHVFKGVSTEQEPSAQQVATLVKLIKQEQVPAVFTENTVNPRLAEQIADEAGVKVVTNLYTDALGEPGSDADSYIKLMRHDVQVIIAALK